MQPDRFIVIDTETSGLFDFAKPANDPGQPRMAALSMLFVSPDLLTVEREYSALIKPDGWVMEEQAVAVNGLTMERLETEGVPVVQALDEYEQAIRSGRVVAAFNAQYDAKVLRAEFRHADRDDMFMITRNTCLMRGCHSAGVPKREKRGGFPNLADALAHIGVENSGAHTALGDALGALEVLRWLVRTEQLIPPGVHLKKPVGAAPARKPRAVKAGPASADDEIPA